MTPWVPVAQDAVSVSRVRARAALVRGAFTLIELLVVIAIIGLLAALLLPALVRAQATAEATRCAGSIRQLAIGMQVYVDNTRCFPGHGGVNWLSTAGLYQYVPAGQNYRCATAMRRYRIANANTYAMNEALAYRLVLNGATLTNTLIRTTDVVDPSGTMLFVDDGYVAGRSVCNFWSMFPKAVHNLGVNADTGNAAFIDGHVKRLIVVPDIVRILPFQAPSNWQEYLPYSDIAPFSYYPFWRPYPTWSWTGPS